MVVVVTGASGHIGNCLVRELSEKGASVRVLVHKDATGPGGPEVVSMMGSVTEPGILTKLCQGADVVFHLAARISLDNRHPGEDYAVNVLGTGNMLRAAHAAGVRKFIHFSSVEAMLAGPGEQGPDEKRPLVDSMKNIYGYTKAESERLVMRAAKEGLDAVILSPTAVIGPFDFKLSFSGRAIIQLYRNRLPFLISGGYDWIDVRDVVRSTIRSIEKGRKGEKYILGGNYCSVEELSRMIATISGNPPSKRYVPASLARLAAPCFALYADLTRTRPLYTTRSIDLLSHPPKSVSSEKAKTELDHSVRPLIESLRDTIAWFKEHNYIR